MYRGFLLLTLCGITLNYAHAQWVNPLGGMLSRSCMYGFGISELKSQFNQYKKDRQWDVQCSKIGEEPHGENCVWTNELINNVTEDINFMCNRSTVGFEGYISGLYSDQKHNDTFYHPDRRWRAECCTSNGVRNGPCVVTDYANNYEGDMNFIVPENKVLNGLISKYNDRYGDRRWQFQICDKIEGEGRRPKKKIKNSTLNDQNTKK